MRICILILVCFVCSFAFAKAPLRKVANADLNIIRQNIYNELLATVPANEASTWKLDDLKKWISTQQDDGSWADVDYIETKRTLWGPAIQIQRTRFIYIATKTPGHPLYQSEEAIAAANLALKFFSSKKWYHVNWWHREIGLPRNIYTLLIVANDQIPKEYYDVLMDYAYQGHLTDHPSQWPATGQNNIWFSETTVALAVLFERPEWVSLAIASVEKEFTTGNKAGIQADQSFYQHGQVFHNGGYGMDFSNDVANFFKRINGSSFAFSPGAYGLLSQFILDGQMWLIHNKVMDYSSKARHYPRPNGGSSDYLLPSCKIFADMPGPRQQEFKDCTKKLTEKNFTRTGNKMFFRGDFMTHHRPEYNISVKMHSVRVYNNDTSPLGEGLKSHHLSDGVTYVYRTGEEYVDIFPIWDFKLVPGTTEEYVFPYPKVPKDDYYPSFGETRFVGGVSDGMFGAAVMDYSRENLQAKKSWFFSNSGMLSIGAGINCHSCQDVRTNIVQEWSQSPITYGAIDSFKEETLESGKKKITAPSWFIANGVGYVVDQGKDISLNNSNQSGTWRSIDASRSTVLSTGKVTNVWLSHGKKPAGDSYVYHTYPETKSLVELMKKRENVKILSNTISTQAVFFQEEQMVQVIFHKAGTLQFDNKESSLTVNAAVALMLQKLPNGKFKVTAADPAQNLSSVQITFNWKSKGESKVTLTFPKGQFYGDSVSKEL